MIFKNKINSNWLSLIFTLNVLAPSTKVGYIIQLISLFVLLFFFRKNKVPMQSGLMVVLMIFLSFIFSVFKGYNFSETETIVKFAVIAITIGLFPICTNNVISNKFLLFIIGFILISQVGYAIRVNSIISFIDKFYPAIAENYQTDRISSIYETSSLSTFFRFGGIYRNGNHAARMVSLIFAIFLAQKRESGFKDIYSVLFLPLTFISIILTGSRTGLIIVILLTGYKIFFIQKISFFKKTVILIFSIFIIILLGSLNLRSLDFDIGATGSIGLRIEFLSAYLNAASESGTILSIFFGNFNYLFDTNNLLGNTMLSKFDSEVGYILYSLGLFGLISIVFFYYNLKRKTDIYYNFLLIILLWMIPSTILFSLKFNLVYFIALSFSFRKHLLEKKEIG